MRKEIASSWKRQRGKWIGAATGGVICLFWAILPLFILLSGQYFLFASLSKVFIIVNFFITPFYVYGACILSIIFLTPYETFVHDEGGRKKLAWNICRILICTTIKACAGALLGLYITGIANLNTSYIPFCILGCAIVGAVPYIGDFFIFCGLLLQIYFVIQNWHYLEYAPSQLITPSSSMVSPLLYMFIIAFPPLMAVPCSTYLGFEAGGFILAKVQKTRLKLIESRIKNLRMIIEKHKVVLTQKKEIEQNINKIVGLDPNNFGLKVTLYRERAQTIISDQIQTRIIEIEEDLERVIQARKQVEDKLKVLHNEKDILEERLKDVNNRIHILEVIDPANIKIKMQKLKAEWEGIRKQELERIKPTGELETLYKEELLLNFLIEEKAQEIENTKKELAHLSLKEDTLQLEKLVFEVEKMDRKIKGEEPRFFELQNKLNNLERKRDKIKEFLQHN